MHSPHDKIAVPIIGAPVFTFARTWRLVNLPEKQEIQIIDAPILVYLSDVTAIETAVDSAGKPLECCLFVHLKSGRHLHVHAHGGVSEIADLWKPEKFQSEDSAQ